MKARDERRVFATVFEKQELSAEAKLIWHFGWRKAGGAGRTVTLHENDLERWLDFAREATSGSIEVMVDQCVDSVGELPRFKHEQFPVLLKVIDGLLADFTAGRTTDEAAKRSLVSAVPLMSSEQRAWLKKMYPPDPDTSN
jgi:hypothetical protein